MLESITKENVAQQEETKNSTRIYWKETMQDGSVPVNNYSCQVQEKEAKDLKNSEMDYKKIITTKINSCTEFTGVYYKPKTVVYH